MRTYLHVNNKSCVVEICCKLKTGRLTRRKQVTARISVAKTNLSSLDKFTNLNSIVSLFLLYSFLTHV